MKFDIKISSPVYRPLWVLGAGLIGIVVAQGTGQPVFARLGYVLLLVVVGGLLWALYGVLGVQVERRVLTPRVHIGETIRERISVSNRLPWRRWLIEVIDDSAFPERMAGFVVDIPGRQQRQKQWRTQASIRGEYRMGPTIIVGSDPFGLFRIERVFTSEQVLRVHPRAELVDAIAVGRSLEIGAQRLGRRMSTASPLVVSVREYRPGDPVSRVHWRSTAHRGQLMIKESIREPGMQHWLILDASMHVQEWRGATFLPGSMPIPDSTEEYAVQAVATFAHTWLQQGQSVGLVASGLRRHVLAPAASVEHHQQLFDELAAVRCGGNEPLAQVLQSTDIPGSHQMTLVVVTSDTTTEWVAVLRQYQQLGATVLVVLIDPLSFAGGRDTHEVEQQLHQGNVRYVRLQRGELLATALHAVR